LKLHLNNKTANINGINWPVYNQIHRYKVASITLVGLHLERWASLPANSCRNHNAVQMQLWCGINGHFSNSAGTGVFGLTHPPICLVTAGDDMLNVLGEVLPMIFAVLELCLWHPDI